MLSKISSGASYLLIFGLIIFLIMILSESKSWADPSTRGVGSSIIMLAVAGIVFLLLFNFVPQNWLKYLGLALGLLCVVALIVVFLALSGSSLIFQKSNSHYQPHYDDYKLFQLFEAFQKGKVKQWKNLLQSHPEHLHNQQLLQDILYYANIDNKTNARKLESLKYMFDAGVKLDSSHCMELNAIVYSGMADLAELLLQHGADPNCTSLQYDNKKPPIFSTIGGHENAYKVVKVLIKYGADVNVKICDDEREDWVTPLLYGVYVEDWTVCKELIANGASLDFKTKDGLSIKDRILQKAANIKAQGYQDNNLISLLNQI